MRSSANSRRAAPTPAAAAAALAAGLFHTTAAARRCWRWASGLQQAPAVVPGRLRRPLVQEQGHPARGAVREETGQLYMRRRRQARRAAMPQAYLIASDHIIQAHGGALRRDVARKGPGALRTCSSQHPPGKRGQRSVGLGRNVHRERQSIATESVRLMPLQMLRLPCRRLVEPVHLQAGHGWRQSK